MKKKESEKSRVFAVMVKHPNRKGSLLFVIKDEKIEELMSELVELNFSVKEDVQEYDLDSGIKMETITYYVTLPKNVHEALSGLKRIFQTAEIDPDVLLYMDNILKEPTGRFVYRIDAYTKLRKRITDKSDETYEILKLIEFLEGFKKSYQSISVCKQMNFQELIENLKSLVDIADLSTKVRGLFETTRAVESPFLLKDAFTVFDDKFHDGLRRHLEIQKKQFARILEDTDVMKSVARRFKSNLNRWYIAFQDTLDFIIASLIERIHLFETGLLIKLEISLKRKYIDEETVRAFLDAVFTE